MSRYVEVGLGVDQIEPVLTALTRMGATWERDEAGLVLEGGIECADQPVDVRIVGTAWGTVGPFGLTLDHRDVQLVCGEHDLPLLNRGFLPRLRAELAHDALRAAADLRVGPIVRAADGSVRVELRRRR